MDSNFQSTAPINPTSATPFAPMQSTQTKPQGQNVQGFITAARAKGVPDTQIYSYLQQKGHMSPPKQDTPSDPRVSHLSDISDQYSQAKQSADKDATDVMNPSNNFGQRAESLLHLTSDAASEISSPFAPLVKPVSNIVHDVGNEIGDNKQVQQFANSKPGDIVEHIAQDTADVSNIVGTVAGAKGLVDKVPEVVGKIQSGVDTAKTGINNTIQSVKDTVTPNPDAVNKSIVDNYNKAIKPTVAGKNNVGAIDKTNKNIVSGVNSIVANKDNLIFTDKNGEEITGQTPKTVMDTANAIAQTKRALFSQYDALAKQAGETGAQISTEPIAGELDKVINNQALQVTHPEAISYAKDLQSRLQNADGTYKSFDPETTQEMIKNYNNSLEAFYKNPSFDAASKASINAGIVNNLRQALDSTIEKITSGKDSANAGQYQQLKSQYGALTALEKDVAKRANVLARQSGHGLADYADIFSGGDMVHGIMSANPALFVKGAAQAGLTKYFNYLKSPDRAISNMFDAAQGKTSILR